jgi:hypothetical protein
LSKNFSRPKPPSKVFQDLSSRNIANITLDDYDNLIKNAYLESDNIDYLSDLAKVIQFQQKPKGLQLTKVTQSGTVNSSTHVDLLEVPAGVTYDIQAVTVISVSAAACVMDYTLDDIDLGLDYLLKSISFSGSERGYTVDFSTMGDFLISGLADSSVKLACSRNSGSGTISGHNVYYRQVN